MRRLARKQVFTARCPEADEVILCCDCLGWFPMQKVDREHWALELHLPTGRHHVRYYVRTGRVTSRHDEEDLEVGVLPEPTGPGSTGPLTPAGGG